MHALRYTAEMAWVDIYDRNSTYSYPTATWTSAKETAKRSIVRNLHNPNAVFTTYGDLVNELRPLIDFGSPRNAVFHASSVRFQMTRRKTDGDSFRR